MSGLTATGPLLGFVARQNRIRLPIWVGSIVAFVMVGAVNASSLYPTAEARASRALFVSNPAAKAMYGPGHGLEDYTWGAMVANETLLWAALAAAFMSYLTVVRHTRGEEESGRAELIRAAVVGRHAGTSAALAVAVAADLVLGVALLVALVGAAGLPVAGSVAYAASAASAGIVFAAVGAVAAQLTSHARAATGLAGAALGTAFVVRAIGDIGDGTLSWLSPLGWPQATRAYVDERWWPLALPLLAAAVLIGVAVRAESRRDLGAGRFPDRPGPSGASDGLASTVGLALRLHRGTLIGWAVGVAAFGAFQGGLLRDAEQFFTDNPQLERIFTAIQGGDATEQALAFILQWTGLLASGYALQCLVRARSEETTGRAEAVLATAVRRRSWFLSHVAVAALGAALVVLAGGLAIGATFGAVTADASVVTRIAASSLAEVPAVWVVVAAMTAILGVVPRAIAGAWAAFAAIVFVELFGPLLQLSARVTRFSPFSHPPDVPAVPLDVGPLLGLTAVALVLATVGTVGFARRDLHAT